MKEFKMINHKFIIMKVEDAELNGIFTEDLPASFVYEDVVYYVFVDDDGMYEGEEITEDMLYYAVMAYVKHVISVTISAVTNMKCRRYDVGIETVEELKDEYARQCESTIGRAIYNAFSE